MKKLFYFIPLIALALSSCNPLEDINDELDAIPAEPNVGAFEYTLTEGDYSDLGLDFQNFGSNDEARTLIPGLLDGLYPLYGQGSSVLVNYKVYAGSAEGINNYTNADVYELTDEDYANSGSDAYGFYPDMDASDAIAQILDTQISSPIEGQVVLAEYRQYFETPEIGLANFYEATFPGDFSDFELVSVSGREDLGWSTDTGYIVGNGFDSGQFAVEEWLISPEIDLSNESDVLFTITQEIDFLNDRPDLIDILVSTDYTTGGDASAATWTAVDFDKTAFGSMTSLEDVDFSSYDGETIHIGLKYSSTDEVASRWRVESFAVQAIGVSGETDVKGEFFAYEDGAWSDVEDVYFLSVSDYDSMGEGSGEPGRFNNFSSSTPADSYIPTFLELKYPYAQEDDQIFIIYKYYSSSAGETQTRGNLYSVVEDEWMARQTVQQTSLQFGYDNNQWVPDNTIRYYLSTPDFEYIASAFGDNPLYEAAVASMVSFGNFDRRTGNPAYWSNEMILEVVSSLLDNVVAQNAAEGQKFVVSYDIYDGSSGVESISIIKLDGEWVYQE